MSTRIERHLEQANADLKKAIGRLKEAAKRLADAPHLLDLRMETRLVANAATDYAEQYTVVKTLEIAASMEEKEAP